MATDSWLPHRFAALPDRLSMRNGIMLMAGAALAALIYTGGDVSKLVVMYRRRGRLTSRRRDPDRIERSGRGVASL